MRLTWRLPAPLREAMNNISKPKDQRDASDTDEDAVGLLDEGEKDHSQGPQPTRNLVNGRSRKFYACIGIAVLLLVLVAIVLPSKKLSGKPTVPFEPPIPAKSFTRHDRYFHTVFPIPLDSVDLCKTVLSGAVLNWPTPWVISWDSALDANGSVMDAALTKLEHTSAWLDSMPGHRDDDPMAIFGNPHTWYQVRPEVFLKRYQAILRRGDARLEGEFSSETIEMQNMHTRVVFSSEKECPSSREKGAGCLGVPAEDNSLHYLSTNVVVGTLKELRTLWHHALEKARSLSQSGGLFDEHSIFANILADQDIHRKSIRKLEDISSDVQVSENGGQDFGIYLDFGRELSYAADNKMDGVDWVQHSGDGTPKSSKSVPNDIALSTKPFWTISNTGMPNEKTWADVKLLTGLRANIVPALVQQGPDVDKAWSNTDWKKLWFHPYARQLLDSYALTPVAPLAILHDGQETEERFWSPHWEKVGLKTVDLKFHAWDSFCGTEQDAEDLFLDSKGTWKDPRP